MTDEKTRALITEIDTVLARYDTERGAQPHITTTCRSIVDALRRAKSALSALSRAAAPEPEWEWGVQATVNIDGSPNARIELVTEKELPHLRDSQRRGWCNLHRRRKAGPWELLPVGGETDGD